MSVGVAPALDAAGYIRGLTLFDPPGAQRVGTMRAKGNAGPVPQAAVDAGAVISFVGGLTEQERDDVLDSVQLAQRVADQAHDRWTALERWYGKNVEVLERVGWVVQQFGFVKHEKDGRQVRIDKNALSLIGALATGTALTILTQALGALEKMADDDDVITMFAGSALAGRSGSFQLGTVHRGDNGALCMAAGAFHFRTTERQTKGLFASWSSDQVDFWSSVHSMTLDGDKYAKVRQLVRDKLGSPEKYLASLGPLD